MTLFWGMKLGRQPENSNQPNESAKKQEAVGPWVFMDQIRVRSLMFDALLRDVVNVLAFLMLEHVDFT